MNIDKFKSDCLNKKCNRHTFYNEKQCAKESKQEKCFNKLNLKIDKDKKKVEAKILEKVEAWEEKKQKFNDGEIDTLFDVDVRLLKVYKEVDERDKYECVIWNHILNAEQKTYILSHFYKDFNQLKVIDHAHIESVGRRPDLKYDKDNIVCMYRFFHSRFDTQRDVVLGCGIDKKERDKFVKILKKYVKEKNN